MYMHFFHLLTSKNVCAYNVHTDTYYMHHHMKKESLRCLLEMYIIMHEVSYSLGRKAWNLVASQVSVMFALSTS